MNKNTKLYLLYEFVNENDDATNTNKLRPEGSWRLRGIYETFEKAENIVLRFFKNDTFQTKIVITHTNKLITEKLI